MTMEKLEWFVVLRNDRTSDIMNVNDSRKCLFTQKCRNFLTQQIGDGERTLQVGNTMDHNFRSVPSMLQTNSLWAVQVYEGCSELHQLYASVRENANRFHVLTISDD